MKAILVLALSEDESAAMQRDPDFSVRVVHAATGRTEQLNATNYGRIILEFNPVHGLLIDDGQQNAYQAAEMQAMRDQARRDSLEVIRLSARVTELEGENAKLTEKAAGINRQPGGL